MSDFLSLLIYHMSLRTLTGTMWDQGIFCVFYHMSSALVTYQSLPKYLTLSCLDSLFSHIYKILSLTFILPQTDNLYVLVVRMSLKNFPTNRAILWSIIGSEFKTLLFIYRTVNSYFLSLNLLLNETNHRPAWCMYMNSNIMSWSERMSMPTQNDI